MEKKLKSYFDSHPAATEVHVARGVLFVNPGRAKEYADMEKGQKVETVNRDEFEKSLADAEQKEIDAQKQADAEAAQKKADEEAAQKQADADAALKKADEEAAQKQADADKAKKNADADAAKNADKASK